MSLTIRKIPKGPNCSQCPDYSTGECPLARVQRAVENLATVVNFMGAEVEVDGLTAAESGLIKVGHRNRHYRKATPAGGVATLMGDCLGTEQRGEVRMRNSADGTQAPLSGYNGPEDRIAGAVESDMLAIKLT
jgi:hypothetical protein